MSRLNPWNPSLEARQHKTVGWWEHVAVDTGLRRRRAWRPGSRGCEVRAAHTGRAAGRAGGARVPWAGRREACRRRRTVGRGRPDRGCLGGRTGPGPCYVWSSVCNRYKMLL